MGQAYHFHEGEVTFSSQFYDTTTVEVMGCIIFHLKIFLFIPEAQSTARLHMFNMCYYHHPLLGVAVPRPEHERVLHLVGHRLRGDEQVHTSQSGV